MDRIDYFRAKVDANFSPIDFITAQNDNPDGYFLLDVRVKLPESKLEYVKGAHHIPLDELTDRVDELPTDKTIVVYCWEVFCSMGAKAAVVLIENGFDVKELAGGIGAWKLMGFETEY